MAAKYQPPTQSVVGQIFDAVLLMAAVFFALWAPLYFGLAGAAKVDWLPGAMTTEAGADGSTVLKNDQGLVKKIGADGAITFEGLTWEGLQQNAEMQTAWQKLWDSQGVQAITGGMGQAPADAMEGAALIITSRYDYTFSWAGLIATLAVVAGYFAFLVTYSDREYREVIAEKFGAN